MKEYQQLLKDYEVATNTHDWKLVSPFIHENASYFFTDGTHIGKPAIKKAITKTFASIKKETYTISNVEWIITGKHICVCRYDFVWKGMVKGQPASGSGRGTNVWLKNAETDSWQIIHEHLSA